MSAHPLLCLCPGWDVYPLVVTQELYNHHDHLLKRIVQSISPLDYHAVQSTAVALPVSLPSVWYICCIYKVAKTIGGGRGYDDFFVLFVNRHALPLHSLDDFFASLT